MALVTSPYLTAEGRWLAPRIDSFSVGRYGNLLVSSVSSYSFDRVGACEVASRLDRWFSSLPKNLMKSSADALFLANAEMAKLCPPRVETPCLPSPGSGATSNLPATCEEPSVRLAFAHWYGHCRWNSSSPAWNARRPSSSL